LKIHGQQGRAKLRFAVEAGSFSSEASWQDRDEKLEAYTREGQDWEISLTTSGVVAQTIHVGGGNIGTDRSSFNKAENSLKEIVYLARNTLSERFFFTPANRNLALPCCP